MSKKSEPTGVLYGWPPRSLMACIWFAFFVVVLFVALIYVFEDSSNVVVGAARFLIHAALFTVATVPFISLTILLFSWKPTVEVGNGMVRFPNIGLTLSPADVASAIPQESKLSENWRVAIELQPEVSGRYRTWLLWPVAFAWGRKIFVVTMFFGASEGEIQRRIVEILSPSDSSGARK